MSYDLQVWARLELTDDELTGLVRDAGLAAAGDGTVVRGARARYCFPLDHSRVEPEDVPDEVVAAVLAPKALTDALYAVAEVQRNLVWNGRTVWHDRVEEPTAYLAARGEWAGLPPYPVWWSWFGPDYVPLVEEHLPAEQIERVAGCLFRRAAEDPADRDTIGAEPLPPALLARDRRIEGAVGIYVDPADVLPDGYR